MEEVKEIKSYLCVPQVILYKDILVGGDALTHSDL